MLWSGGELSQSWRDIQGGEETLGGSPDLAVTTHVSVRGNPTAAHLLQSRLESCFMPCYWQEGMAPAEWWVSVGSARGPQAWAACHCSEHSGQSDSPLARAAAPGNSLIKVILFAACLEMFLRVEKFTSGSFLGLSPFLPFPLHAAQRCGVLLNGK